MIKSLSRVVGAMDPPPRLTAAPSAFQRALAQLDTDKQSLALGVVGGIAGAYTWDKHRVLGFLSGSAIGDNVHSLMSESQRPAALRNLAAHGAGVVGSLAMNKDGDKPIMGFVGFVAAFIAGSIGGKYLEDRLLKGVK